MSRNVHVIVIVAASLLTVGFPSQGLAQERCSEATLQGDYLVYGTAEARLDQQDDPSFPRRQIEIWNFDGVGSLSGLITVNAGGRVSRDTPTSAIYAVDPDVCVALVTFGSGAQWEVFITRDGREGAGIRVDPDQNGQTILGSRYLKRRSRRSHGDRGDS
jgi:hypothetical protein